eukprot:1473641-Pleurochrysis_carterae.AAC.1
MGGRMGVGDSSRAGAGVSSCGRVRAPARVEARPLLVHECASPHQWARVSKDRWGKRGGGRVTSPSASCTRAQTCASVRLNDCARGGARGGGCAHTGVALSKSAHTSASARVTVPHAR